MTSSAVSSPPMRTTACQTDNDALQHQVVDNTGDLPESVLPREFRSRMHRLFERIERDYEREYQKLIAENYALQEKLYKFEDGEHPESSNITKRLSASQLSHRIKQQYKQSTSRLISNLRPGASGGLSLPLAITGTGGLGVGSDQFSASSGSWKFVHRFSGHRDGVWEATCFRNLVATASADSTVRLWSNSEMANCLMIYSGHAGSVNSVRFRDRDNLMLTCSGDGTAHLIRLQAPIIATKDGQTVSEPPEGDANGAAAADAKEAQPPPAPLVLRDPTAVFQSASLFSPPPSATESTTLADAPGSLESSPLAAADFLPGREQLVTASWDRLGRLYDLNTGQEIQSLAGHDHELTDVRCATTCNAPVVVTSARDSTFRVWDFRHSRLEVHVQHAHNRTVSTAQFLPGPNPHHIVSAGTDRSCRLWDLRNQRAPLFTVRTDAGINRLAISARRGATVTTACAAAGSPLTGVGDGFASDGPSDVVFALPLDNRTVRLIDAGGTRVGRIPRNITHGHTLTITSAAWADDGLCNFFTTGFDHQLLGWQLQVS